MVTVVVILTLILDACVSKLKTILRFLIKNGFKNICLNLILKMPNLLLFSVDTTNTENLVINLVIQVHYRMIMSKYNLHHPNNLLVWLL